MTPFILDIQQGGHHATDQEDKDGHKNYTRRVMMSLMNLVTMNKFMNMVM